VSARGSERPAEVPPPSPASSASSWAAGADVGLSLDELDVVLRVGGILQRLRFGSVLIVVQDGRVVQIEMAEKVRL
jgi:hypothetical protein